MANILGRTLPIVLATCIGVVCAWPAPAEEFSLEIGSPVAARSFRAKAAAFAVRSKGCADPANFELSGTAEGSVNGERRAIPLERITAMPAPGVFAVLQEWPREGAWVVSLIGKCDQATAGALVPMGRKTYLRESSRFFSRPAVSEEIEAALQVLSETLRHEPEGNP